ncbi:MAG: hypothetical protein J6S71_05525 [Clostridia bacterium]|nr:hypothetical protein [Clostridia bacterium]
MYIYPDGAFKTGTGQSIFLLRNGKAEADVIKSETGHFYKVRVWDSRYQ